MQSLPQMLLVDNMVHSDLHPGNILVRLEPPWGTRTLCNVITRQLGLQVLVLTDPVSVYVHGCNCRLTLPAGGCQLLARQSPTSAARASRDLPSMRMPGIHHPDHGSVMSF